MRLQSYHILKEENVASPALVYYKDCIVHNIQHTIALAGSVDRVWCHVKTHKTRELVAMQLAMGLSHFVCATIAEAEITALSGAPYVLVAYPLLGSNIPRFVALSKSYPRTQFWALGDDCETLRQLSDAAENAEIAVQTLLDVNVGHGCTGVSLSRVEEMYLKCSELRGLKLKGLYCYDGRNRQINPMERQTAVSRMDAEIEAIRQSLNRKGMDCSTVIMAGTPSFACHAKASNFALSPSTSIVLDACYAREVPDLEMFEAGAILTRVVSRTASNMFTLDLGSRGISCDQTRIGEIVGVPATPVFQSDEHWLWKMNEGFEDQTPEIGSIQYVIPERISSSTALYPSILVVEDAKITDEWVTIARSPKLSY